MRPEPREYCFCQHVCHMYRTTYSGRSAKGRRHAVGYFQAARSSLDLTRQMQFLNASCVWSSTFYLYDPLLNDHCPFPSSSKMGVYNKQQPKIHPQLPKTFFPNVVVNILHFGACMRDLWVCNGSDFNACSGLD